MARIGSHPRDIALRVTTACAKASRTQGTIHSLTGTTVVPLAAGRTM